MIFYFESREHSSQQARKTSNTGNKLAWLRIVPARVLGKPSAYCSRLEISRFLTVGGFGAPGALGDFVTILHLSGRHGMSIQRVKMVATEKLQVCVCGKSYPNRSDGTGLSQ